MSRNDDVGSWDLGAIRGFHPTRQTAISLASASIAFILPLIYFKMRFVFLDVLIKRGLLLTLLVATSWIYSYWCILPLRRALAGEDSTVGIAILFIGSVLYTLLCMSLYGRLNRALDRVLFRRADYARLVSEISSAIQQHVESQSLLEYLTGLLKKVMEAESVMFLHPGPGDGCDLRADSGFGQEVKRQSDTARGLSHFGRMSPDPRNRRPTCEPRGGKNLEGKC